MAASSPVPDPKWKIARSFPRFAIDLATTIHSLGEGETPPLSGRMVDIGLGGACVELEPGTLAPRQKVVLEFRLAASPAPLKLRAHVRHCDDVARCGFQFADVQGEEREKIRRACVGLRIV